MDKFIIQGGKKLEGQVEIRGSKNAAGAILAACLLTKEPCVIGNLPLVDDILNLLEVISEMGAKIEWIEKRKVKITAGDNLDVNKIDFEKFSKARTSVLLLGALVARFNQFKVSRPGGDRIGLRPITTHLDALEALGCKIKEQGDFYEFNINELKGAEIILPEFSVTATEILLMAGCLAKGHTIVKIAAGEPHIQELVLMLNKMGGDIKWEGTHSLIINGVEKLNGVEYSIIPDALEVGTFLIIGALCGGEITVPDIEGDYLDLFLEKLKEAGVNFKRENGFIKVKKSDNLKPIKVQALPYPGFPTDLLPLIVPLLTQAKGKSLLHDPLYENRLNYIHQLRKMGADIEIVDPHRAFIFGPTELSGVSIESTDIRAGACLIVAGLLGQGETIISNVSQIDRGYERIEERLAKLGAEIKRISN
ncbi:MAG: UDP-N-acetylglucosamine 1-carboxyvinyltransferase [Candidatus Pacebacteria bacterium]|nr:UDP-N-acetylglucosamine 1-carboxyvinyltransferase [Candidatus Paceibacterota bacterium]